MVIARQAAEIVILKQTIDALCRRIFGASSEKLDAAQLELMLEGDLARTATTADPEDPGPATEIPTHKKAPKETRATRIPEHLPVVREELDPPEVLLNPDDFRRIGEEVREQLSVVRRAKQGASYQVKDLLFQNLASRNYRVLQLC